MEIIYSKHWIKKQRDKKEDITNDKIEFAITNSKIFNDKYWTSTLNAVVRIPPSGRTLKVVYKKLDQKIFIITAYWLN
ncbi:MAG: DUF4258 domain-containing protein [Nanoarchaeota archaeon]|nr:DUF4258 domain-containing protein [Nanoarchaeota archaeon]